MEDMFSQYDPRHAQSVDQAPQQPPRPLPQMALAIREPSRVKQIALTGLMLGLLGGLGFLGWQAMEESRAPVDEADLPIIKASSAPYKQKPMNPGGMEIPDKGRMVFNTISTSAGGKQDVIDIGMAQLTPPPEEPATAQEFAAATGMAIETPAEAADVAMAEPAAGDAEAEAVSVVPLEPITPKPLVEVTLPLAVVPVIPMEPATEEAGVEEAAPIATPEQATPEPTTSAHAMYVPVPVKKPAIKVIRLSKNPAPSKPTASKAVVATENAVYRVQLGSYSSQKSLELGWLSLQKKFPNELGKLHRSVEIADLGAKGTFYRLHAGILSNSSAAQAICDKLKAQSQGCILAK